MKPIYYATVCYERKINSGEIDALWQIAKAHQGLELATNAEMGLISFGFEKKEKRKDFTTAVDSSQSFKDVIGVRLGQLR